MNEKVSEMRSQHLHIVAGLELWQWREVAIASAILHDVSPGEVDWLLQEVAGLDRLALRLESFKDWSKIKITLSLEDLKQLWQRRLEERLPVQYITGVTPWRNLRIVVSNAVLIPRPETESLIDIAVAATKDRDLQLGHWADLGTGSGAVAVGLADALPQSTIHAVDYSREALAIARCNAANYGLDGRIKFYEGSWWEPLGCLKGEFSGMVSNPPYIPSANVTILQPEVVNHEPHLALDGGADGLNCIRELIAVAPDYLRAGGVWLIEMMAGQADTVKNLLEVEGKYYNIEIYNDLAGIERFALAYVRK